MSEAQTKVLTIFAPAKINLYLHVTGRLDNGYHTLDSLIAFADIGDQIIIEPATDFKLSIDGPYAGAFNAKERDASPHSSNLLVQAVWSIAQAAQKVPNVHISLTKNLPLASGLGGGSADAAAAIWGLLEWWEISNQASYLPGLMARLGADIPVCLHCRPTRVRGIGDVLDPVPLLDEIPVILINPGKPCPTAEVFMHYAHDFKEPIPLPDDLEDFSTLVEFLRFQDNDLSRSACEIVPEIKSIIEALQGQDGCALARLSGAGATCFGLFKSEKDAQKAAREISANNPDWWVRTGFLNRPERY